MKMEGRSTVYGIYGGLLVEQRIYLHTMMEEGKTEIEIRRQTITFRHSNWTQPLPGARRRGRPRKVVDSTGA